MVGINIEEARGPAGGFAEEFGINYLLPMDFGGGVTRAYGVFGPPHTYLIDSDGLLVEIIRGQAPDEVLGGAGGGVDDGGGSAGGVGRRVVRLVQRMAARRREERLAAAGGRR